MTDKETLRPCPFCGYNAREGIVSKGYYTCGNASCGMISLLSEKLWNFRAPSPEVKALQAERDAMAKVVEAAGVVAKRDEYLKKRGAWNERDDIEILKETIARYEIRRGRKL